MPARRIVAAAGFSAIQLWLESHFIKTLNGMAFNLIPKGRLSPRDDTDLAFGVGLKMIPFNA